MDAAISPFPDDVEALKALLAVALERAEEAEARTPPIELPCSASPRASNSNPDGIFRTVQFLAKRIAPK